MSKRELIDAIREHNRTVSPEFLARFRDADLQAYLERVSVKRRPREMPRMRATVDAKESLIVA